MIVITSGNVGNVDLKYVGDKNTAILTVSVADQEYDNKKKENVTTWVNAKFIGSRAEGLADTMQKAQVIEVIGKEQYRIYNDKIVRDVLVDNFKVLAWKAKKEKTNNDVFAGEGTPIYISDSDLPF